MSRWDKIKNFNLAIDISHELLRDGIIEKVVFVGKNVNSSNEELLNLLDKNNLRGIFELKGFQADLSEFYEDSSFTLISSHSESCPMVLLESFSYGKPCFSTNVGDVRRIYEYSDDFIYDTVSEAKDKITAFLTKSETERKQIGIDLIELHDKNYSLNAMKKYYSLYEDCFW